MYSIGYEIIPGNYIDKFVGEGNLGSVYIIKNQLGLTSAIKILDKNIKFNPGLANSYLKLRSKNIVCLQDYGQIDTGECYLLWEHLDNNLEKILINVNDVNTACSYILQILNGLKALEDSEIIHGNIKPSNILFANHLKISDWGMINLIPESQFFLDRISTGIYFLSPEQLNNELTPLMDSWAASVIFYYMLSGYYPFQGNTCMEVCNSILQKDADLYDIPEEVHGFFKISFQKDKNKRHGSIRKMIEQINALMKNSMPVKKKKISLKKKRKKKRGCITCL